MAHTKQDRVAERDTELCAAYGCPMLGVMSRSTNGGGFMCGVHFDFPEHLQEATVEINRNVFIAYAIRDIRKRSQDKDWANTFRQLQTELAQNNRSDLCYKKNEDVQAWQIRLENEIYQIVKSVVKPNQQPQLNKNEGV